MDGWIDELIIEAIYILMLWRGWMHGYSLLMDRSIDRLIDALASSTNIDAYLVTTTSTTNIIIYLKTNKDFNYGDE
jgi:hypothetical protein